MNHREYLRLCVNMRQYAEVEGIPYPMLSKIKCARISTPPKYFEAVVKATNGLVTHDELLAEAGVFQELKRLKREKQNELNALRAERRKALRKLKPKAKKPEVKKPSEQEKATAKAKAKLVSRLLEGKEIHWSVTNNRGVNNFPEFVESLRASGLKVRTGTKIVSGVRYELLKLAPSVLATVQGLGGDDEPM